MPAVIVCCADVLICMMIKNSVRQRRAKTKKKRGDTNRHIYAKNLFCNIPYFILKYIDTALVSCKQAGLNRKAIPYNNTQRNICNG